MTAENYAPSWNALKARYANKKILVDTQLKLPFNQPSIQSDSPEAVRKMIDTTKECINALRVLNIDIATWDPILLFILIQKLSKESHSAWELSQVGEAELSTFANFITFLENRFRVLESLASRTPVESNLKSRHFKSHAIINTPSSTTNACSICSDKHYIRDCPKVLHLAISDRRNLLAQHRICFNCLVPGHLLPDCKSRMNCQVCRKRHHTLLHDTNFESKFTTSSTNHRKSSSSQHQQGASSSHHNNSNAQASSSVHNSQPNEHIASSSYHQPNSQSASSLHHPYPNSQNSTSTSYHVQPNTNNIPSIVCSSNTASSYSTTLPSSPALLATAIVHAVSSSGALISLSALIDQGSQISFMTENAAQLLNLKSRSINYSVSGIGNTSAGLIRKVVQLIIRSPLRNDFAPHLNAFVIKNVTGILPPTRCFTTLGHLLQISISQTHLSICQEQ